MQEKQIQKYEKMMMVTCKDGRILLFPKSKEKSFNEALIELVFIPIEGVRVNKFEIKYIEELPQNYDVLISLDEDTRNKALAEFRKSKDATGVEPSREVKIKKIQRILESKNL